MSFKNGERVYHFKYGSGTVVNINPETAVFVKSDTEVGVLFDERNGWDIVNEDEIYADHLFKVWALALNKNHEDPNRFADGKFYMNVMQAMERRKDLKENHGVDTTIVYAHTGQWFDYPDWD